MYYKFIWSSEESQNYRNNINLYEEDFLLMQTELSQATSGQVINENIDRFSKVMSNICDPLFAKTVNPNKCNASIGYDTNKQSWFDEVCKVKRQLFYTALENFRMNKNVQNQRKLSEARKNYKNEIRRKR